MDIGTAKLPVARPRGIPHHLLDLLTVREPATVAEFQGWARAVIADLSGTRTHRRCWWAVLALYTRAVLDRFEFPGTYLSSSREVGGRARRTPALPTSMPSSPSRRPPGRRPDPARQRPPDRARARGHRSCTGRPFSATLPQREYVDPRHRAARSPDRPRAAGATDREAGRRRCSRTAWSTRSTRLLDEGLAEGRTASRAIGYQQVIAHLAGELTLDDARERTAIADPPVRPPADGVVARTIPGSPGSSTSPPPGRAGARRRALRWFRGSSLALLAPQPAERAAG